MLQLQSLMLAGGWDGFKDGLVNFFQNGLGKSGAEGIGIAIMVVGFLMAAISFVMHHINPQSRMPSWIICLIMGIVGAFLTFGMDKPIALFKMARDWFVSLVGL